MVVLLIRRSEEKCCRSCQKPGLNSPLLPRPFPHEISLIPAILAQLYENLEYWPITGPELFTAGSLLTRKMFREILLNSVKIRNCHGDIYVCIYCGTVHFMQGVVLVNHEDGVSKFAVVDVFICAYLSTTCLNWCLNHPRKKLLKSYSAHCILRSLLRAVCQTPHVSVCTSPKHDVSLSL